MFENHLKSLNYVFEIVFTGLTLVLRREPERISPHFPA